MKRHLVYSVSVAVLVCVFAFRGLGQESQNAGHDSEKGNTYYADCNAPANNGDGRSPETAWHGVDEVNGHVFVPGDVVSLRTRMDRWTRLLPGSWSC